MNIKMNDKNGRQPPLPALPPPSIENDTHSENEAGLEKVEICRNYVRGRCNKNTQCKFRHELDFEEMKKILKFCHDYQNPSGCTREHCTFLHTTKEEESLFFATGQLPRVLAERHANMSAAAAETIPQIALFIQESFVGPPPPPPPPPAPVAAPPPVAPVVPPPQRPAPPMMPIQQLPPPPPPLSTFASRTVQQRPPLFTAATQQSTLENLVTQPPTPLLPRFNASVPPPLPIPVNVQTKENPLKRQLACFDAPPKKLQKMDEAREDAPCFKCMLRNDRIVSYKKERDELSRKEEYQTLLYKKKLEEYQNRKMLLKLLVSRDVFKLIEEYVEGTSSVPNSFLPRLMEFLLQNPEVDSVPSSLSQNLTTRPSSSVNPVSPDVMQTFMDIIQQTNLSDRIRAEEIPSSTSNSTATNDSNRLHRFPNGQHAETSASRAPAPAQAPPPPPTVYPVPPAMLYYPPPFPIPTANLSDRIRAEEIPSSTSNSTVTNDSNRLHRFPNGQHAGTSASRAPPPAQAPPPPPTVYPVPPARLYYPPPFPIPAANLSDRIRAEEIPSSTSNSTVTNDSNRLHRFPNGQHAGTSASRAPPPAQAPPPPPTVYPVPPARLYYPPPFPIPAANLSDRIRAEEIPSSTSNSTVTNDSNWLHRFPNGQHAGTSASRAPPPAQAPPPPPPVYPVPPARLYYPPPFPIPAGVSLSRAPPPPAPAAPAPAPPAPAPPAPAPPSCLPYTTTMYQPPYYHRHQ